MYFRIENIKPNELERLRRMFGRRLTSTSSAHFLTCFNEILTALENQLTDQEFKEFMNSEYMPTELNIMAEDLYNNYSALQFDELYEYAERIVYEWSETNNE
jgi:hypothetical protein